MRGLTSHQASQLLSNMVPNTLEVKKKELFPTLLGQFNNSLTISSHRGRTCIFFIGEGQLTALIQAIVIFKRVFGIHQEAKAEGAIAALEKLPCQKSA